MLSVRLLWQHELDWRKIDTIVFLLCIPFYMYFSNFSQPLTEQIRANAQRIADENGIEIEFIRKLRAFRKDDRIQQIIQETGKTKGLIHIFSAMEQCNTYKPWHDKTTGKTFLKFDQSKCRNSSAFRLNGIKKLL